MGKIFYLMGKSSTGKDTIYRNLIQDQQLMLKTVVPYTTRPIRAGEVHGVEYYFTDESGLQDAKNQGLLIEERAYDTCHGIWKYFTVYDKHMDLEHHHYLMIGTLESYLKTRDYFGQETIIPILIDLDDGERLQRALNREKKQFHPKYQELCRRFLADAEDFSDQKIEYAKISHRFYNENLEDCLKEIKGYIKNHM